MPEVESLNDFNITELKSRAKAAGIKGYAKMSKEELVEALDNLDIDEKEKKEE